MKRNKTFLVNEIKEYQYCGGVAFQLNGGEYEIPFKVEKTKTKHDLSNCPNCSTLHKDLVHQFKEKLEKFPNCCKPHQKLNTLNLFSKDDFSRVPEWSADKILFAYHHFIEYIDRYDWYSEITQYVQYCIESFGKMPDNYGVPLNLDRFIDILPKLIEGNYEIIKSSEISKAELKQRTIKILNYINSYFEVDEQKNKNINILLAKYDEWYKIFPFELSYFKELKEHFRYTLPLFRERKHYNKYLGISVYETHSTESLTEFLIQTTQQIIAEINGLSLYQKGKLTEPKKIQLELIIENRKIELTEIGSIDYTKRGGYIKALKEWFESEKKFIKEITPLLTNTIYNQNKSNDLRIPEIALKLVYEGILVTKENCNQIIKEYGYSSGEKLYNEFIYYSRRQNRLDAPNPITKTKFKNKINRFEKVAELLQDPFKEQALDEIKVLKSHFKNEFP